MHGNFELLSRGKRAAIVRWYPAFFFLSFCLYAVFSCFHTTGYEAYSCTTDGYRNFNVRTNLGACGTHDRGGQTQTCLHTIHDPSLILKTIYIYIHSSGIPPSISYMIYPLSLLSRQHCFRPSIVTPPPPPPPLPPPPPPPASPPPHVYTHA